jgi:protein-S-isoprenylcysteine O-methyltransferase Ste14
MVSDPTSLTLLFLAWLGYFVLHSTLASLAVKTWVAGRWPGLMPAYRLGYNVIACLGLLPMLWLLYFHPWHVVWAWSGFSALIANGLALAAIAGVFSTLGDYESGEFLGTSQWRKQTRTVEDQERFHLSTAHRFVRHPWYFFSLVLIWTRDMNEAMLLSALLMTAYFVVGSRLEERKLIAYHGDTYRRYMEKVAGLLPLPWKTLSQAEAEALVSEVGYAVRTKSIR